MIQTATNYRDFIMAMERVERRLREVTSALETAGVRYAVIGGNAVAAWVSRVDPGATRTTKDVDLLVDRSAIDRVAAAISATGLMRENLRDLVLFVDPEEPSRKFGIPLVWAGEKVRPSYLVAAPSVAETVRDPAGFWVLDLPALVRMKLTSFRDIDRVHIRDLFDVGLIDDRVTQSLPGPLRSRLDDITSALDQE